MQFLTLERIKAEYPTLAWSHDELPEPAKRAVDPLKPDTNVYDFATCMREGWRWVFDGWRRFQPKSWAALEAADPALLYAERTDNDPRVMSGPPRLRWSCQGFVRLGERYIQFFPCFKDFSIDEAGKDHPAFERYEALPPAIAQAYYARINGVGFTSRVPRNPLINNVLPAPLWTVWPELPQLAEGAGVRRGDAVKAIRQLSSGRWNRRWESRFVAMLDTRLPDDFSTTGDIIFIDQESKSRRLYHMRDFNFSDVALLSEPEDAIDSYVAHVISGAAGRFDFSRYRGPLA